VPVPGTGALLIAQRRTDKGDSMACSRNDPQRGAARRAVQGFTMVELLITVAILGILAGVAYPSYLKYVARGNRSAAQSFMLEVASRQERYLVDARQYAPDLATLGMSVPSNVSGKYTVTIAGVTATPPAYTIQAVPVGTQQTSDATCGTLSVSSTGAKAATGPAGATSCWSG
jgi:type IV pilus assembly protein PilE